MKYDLKLMKKIRLVLSIAIYFLIYQNTAFANHQVLQPVYLYLSAATAEHLKSKNISYEDSISKWRQYLRKYDKNAKEISKTQLIQRLAPGVLILASSLVLDEEEINAIKTFADTGGSILATGATASIGMDTQVKGNDFLETYFKVRLLGKFDRETESTYLMPFGDGPLTWSLPAGRRMHMGKTPDTHLRVEAENTAAVFIGWARNKGKDPLSSAITYHESSKHRAVFFAFPESSWGYQKAKDMNALMDGTMSWLRREPKLLKAAWPNGFAAGHLIEMDTEDKFASAPNFAADLEKIGVKGTFYSLTSEAIKYPAIVKDLLDRGHEIAYHADVHTGFKSLDAQTQEARIQNMQAQMRTILGDKTDAVTGFRAPTESYDATTEALLRKHGILHHAADPNSHEDRLPSFSKSERNIASSQALIILPRTQLDDLNFQKQLYSAARIDEELAFDLNLAIQGGALSLLSIHSQNYVDGGYMRQPMSKYLGRLTTLKDRLWIARGDQIASWWRKRESVEVKSSPQESGVLMQISVPGPDPVEGLTVVAVHPFKDAAPVVTDRNGHAVKVRLRNLDSFRSALIFEKLGAGTFEYLVRFALKKEG
jgi:Polysaccharide deacetylase